MCLVTILDTHAVLLLTTFKYGDFTITYKGTQQLKHDHKDIVIHNKRST
jgi:hypothetical protein